MIYLLVLVVSIDSLSYGISKGIRKEKLSFVESLIMSFFSSLIFFVPLIISSFVKDFLNEKICMIINGIFLCLLGVFYFIKKEKQSTEEKTKSSLFVSTIIFSLDAFFSALFSSFDSIEIFCGVSFYFVITFVCLFVVSNIVYKFFSKNKVDLSWISGLLFIVLGVLKICGI